ncbi:MAG: peptidase domain-containing ABC transporter [Phycisphaerales bacterium]|nr:peptidase domain-containing ABC transporter [Phycisphaerales bacterium]
MTNTANAPDAPETFGFRSRRRIPVIQGVEIADCGAACLAIVLAYFGKHVGLDRVKEITGTSRDGIDALTLLNTAKWFGLRGRAVRVETHSLEDLAPGTILHWEFNHFLVLERVQQYFVSVVDPALGRRRIRRADFNRSFTGVALQLAPSAVFATEKRKGNLLWKYARHVLSQSGLLARLLLVTIFAQAIGLAVPILTGVLVDRIVPEANYDLLGVLASGLAIMVVFGFLSSVLRAHLLLTLSTLLEARLTLDFLEHLVALPYSFFQQRSAGDLIMRLNSNSIVRSTLTSAALSTILDGIFVLSYLLLLLLMSEPMGLLVLVLGVIQVGLFLLTRRSYRDLRTEGLRVQAKSQGYQVEMMAGMETLKASGAEGVAAAKWTHLFTDVLNVSLKSGRLAALVEPSLELINKASGLGVLLFGGYLVMQGELSLGTMLALNALAASFLAPVSSLINTSLQIQLLTPYIERIRDVIESHPEQKQGEVKPAHRLKGKVALTDVSFRYNPLSPLVVTGVSLSVQPGQHVAIVGPSGSGKSTVARLLLGLCRPETGRIMFDDVDLTTLDVSGIRQQCGIVMQHPYIFAGSIRGNIDLMNPHCTLDEVVDAARRAHLHDEIRAMPMGYDTILSDGGTSLSGGQRQRLAIARALANRPTVLILDEATSALDTITERAIRAELDAMESTTIVIAQRMSTIANSDLVLVMAKGRIVETGDHSSLMKAGGVYADLVRAQSY